jgi:DNA-binding Lrp family transcriptional regulator
MSKKLDSLDVKILEGLAEHGPRNIKRLAEQLNIPRGTVLFRIRRMSSSLYLKLLTTIYHTNLGMKKAVVLAKAKPGYEELLFNCLKVNKFYIYLSRVYGLFEGCLGIYVIPIEHASEFQAFLNEVEKTGATRKIDLQWSTCFHTVNPTRNWFEDSANNWVFHWDTWIKEVFSADSELPYTLKDPSSFPLKADETDLFIVKELEKNAAVSLVSIARKLGTSLPNVRYHYEKHVVKNGLIETYQVAILPFDKATSDMSFFTLRFSDSEKMSKFARTLLDKPFVLILGKILGNSSLVCQIYLPRQELRNFVDALSKLAREGFLLDYEYVLQDLRQGKWSRETIPFQLFKKHSWIYEHSEHVKALQDLVAQTELARPDSQTSQAEESLSHIDQSAPLEKLRTVS